MSFHLRDHTADVAVEATGTSLGAAFAATADGMAAAMCEAIPAEGERIDLSVRAESREALLFDYLDDLIYERDVRSVLPAENRASVSREGEEWSLDGSYRGVPLGSVVARDLKAVTYSEMDVSRSNGGWRVYVVFDV